jgi:ferredoxin
MSETFTITIDKRPVEARPGESILALARKLGIEIPTLCFLERCGPLTSCLVCLVKWNGKMVPSCGTLAEPGMAIESETMEVHEARRTALELLFSDHVGDCLAPCNRLCPLRLNIPVMLRQIESGSVDAAIRTVGEALPLPGILGRLCHHPCEQGCRRGQWDDPAGIRNLERTVTEENRKLPQPYVPSAKPSTGKSVAIIGSGPAGQGTAYYLLREGHAVTLIDRRAQAGGSLRSVGEDHLPPDVLDFEIRMLCAMGVQLRLGTELGRSVTLDDLLREFNAVVIATGETSPAEFASMGVENSGAFIKTHPDTWLTSHSGVFATGRAVRNLNQIVKVLFDAQAAASAVDRFLRGQVPQRPDKPFSSVMGRISPDELQLFLRSANKVGGTPCGPKAGLSRAAASLEASRCLHCDCRSSGSCALQRYAEQYKVDASRFRQQRRNFDQQLQPGGVIFEPGKCILCGICVKLTELAGEELGLTFVGRGFDVRVATPFNRTIEEGLKKVAEDCVRHCPTGALSWKSRSFDLDSGAKKLG